MALLVFVRMFWMNSHSGGKQEKKDLSHETLDLRMAG